MSIVITVVPVRTRRQQRDFQRLPWQIYAGDPNWVPPILSQEKLLLGWSRHPFYNTAKSHTLLAYRNDTVCGRLAVFVNDVHNQKYQEKRGFFGFFECVDDQAVADNLFAQARHWLREQGMTALRGPMNPSQNYTCGLLVDGFDRPPSFMMTYNPPYYAKLIEACGLSKAQDLYAYEIRTDELSPITTKYKPAVLSALEHSNLNIRPFHPKGQMYQQDIATYLDIYNKSLDGTWGFTPLSEAEAQHMAHDLKHILQPEFAVFVETQGKPIGASLALLDYNQILRKLNGRLTPLGFIRLLLSKRKITDARAMALTMLPGKTYAGLGIVMLDNLVEAAKKWHIQRYEFSWVLESNRQSRGSLERAGTRIASTYRIYDGDL